MNALVREMIERGWYDDGSTSMPTRSASTTCSGWSPATRFERVARDLRRRRCGISVPRPRSSARRERLLSTVLQGFYQSNQATAAACAVNNIHLLRGMIGRPGAGVLQMNGQPTAQNNREAGADGDLPGFRNWENIEHVRELARLWNVDERDDPALGAADPRHADLPLRRARLDQAAVDRRPPTRRCPCPISAGSATSSADEDLFVVVQDIFMTETAELADVVLPAATWGERTGTFTNADRTVHLSDQAVEPPGEARSDLDIFLDFARRMDFRDRDGSAADRVARPRIGVRGVEAVFARAGRATTAR